MKALLNIIVLAAIVFAYIISSSFYVQGELILAYSLIIGSIASLVIWIKSNSLIKMLAKA